MVDPQLRQSIWMKRLLDRMKVQYGVSAILQTETSGTINYEVGSPDVSYTNLNLKHLIVLPTNIDDKFRAISTGRENISFGANFEVGDKEALIVASDLPLNHVIEQEDYIVLRSTRYDIIKLLELDFKQGYYLHLRHTQKSIPHQIVDKTYESIVSFTETISGALA